MRGLKSPPPSGPSFSAACKARTLQSNDLIRVSLILDDGGEGIGLETGAAHEGSVNLFLSDKGGGVVWLDAAAVENADVGRDFGSKKLGHFSADDLVRVDGHLGCGGLAGADGPHGLVSDDDGSGDLSRDANQRSG